MKKRIYRTFGTNPRFFVKIKRMNPRDARSGIWLQINIWMNGWNICLRKSRIPAAEQLQNLYRALDVDEC